MIAMLQSPVRAGIDFLRICKHKHNLIWVLAQREVFDRFKGSQLGAFWVVFQPLFMMLFYVFIFSTIFRIRFAADGPLKDLNYPAYFIIGYLPWMTLQDVLQRTCTSITGQQNLVKQVVFPLEVLPIRSILAALVPQAIGLVFLFGYLLVTTGRIPALAAVLPFAIFVQTLIMLGAGFFLSSVSVYFRDIREFISIAVMVGYYLLPIIYPPTVIPSAFSWALEINPFSHLIWMNHDILFYGEITRPLSWVISSALGVAMFTIGFVTFQKLKPYFGNVL